MISLQDKAPGLITRDGSHYIFKGQPDDSEIIIIVHGIGGYHAQFQKLSDHLVTAGYSVLLYDLMGRGFSSFPENPVFDGEAHILQLRSLIEELRLHDRDGKQYHLISHSMGGALATLYTERYHKDIKSLILLSPAGLMDLGPLNLIRGCCSCFQGILKRFVALGQENTWRKDFVSSRSDAENEIVAQLHEMNKLNPKMFDAFWLSALQFPLSNIDTSVQNVAAISSISVLVMWGTLDSAVPYNPNFNRWKKYFDEPLTNRICRFKVYEGFGHGFFLENPLAVQSDIVDFLENVLLGVNIT
jgi:pimeloyl-ACP methyl ester carboxylesterase